MRPSGLGDKKAVVPAQCFVPLSPRGGLAQQWYLALRFRSLEPALRSLSACISCRTIVPMHALLLVHLAAALVIFGSAMVVAAAPPFPCTYTSSTSLKVYLVVMAQRSGVDVAFTLMTLAMGPPARRSTTCPTCGVTPPMATPTLSASVPLINRRSTCTLEPCRINLTSSDGSLLRNSNVCGQTVTTKCSSLAPNGVCQVTSSGVYGDGDASKATWADYRTSVNASMGLIIPELSYLLIATCPSPPIPRQPAVCKA